MQNRKNNKSWFHSQEIVFSVKTVNYYFQVLFFQFQMQDIIEQNGQSKLRFEDWRKVGILGKNISEDILDTESFKKVIR